MLEGFGKASIRGDTAQCPGPGYSKGLSVGGKDATWTALDLMAQHVSQPIYYLGDLQL